jgi:hypothetical protein
MKHILITGVTFKTISLAHIISCGSFFLILFFSTIVKFLEKKIAYKLYISSLFFYFLSLYV